MWRIVVFNIEKKYKKHKHKILEGLINLLCYLFIKFVLWSLNRM